MIIKYITETQRPLSFKYAICALEVCVNTFIYFMPFRNAANHRLHVILRVIQPLNPAHRISVKLWWAAWQLEPEDGTSDQQHHHHQQQQHHHHQQHHLHHHICHCLLHPHLHEHHHHQTWHKTNIKLLWPGWVGARRLKTIHICTTEFTSSPSLPLIVLGYVVK